MDRIEVTKKELAGHEAISNDIVGQAFVEERALKLFSYADTEDRAARFGMNVVKSFYTASILFDVLKQFGELSPEIPAQQKYAKWKATYISTCLKNGETPVAGPVGDDGKGTDDMFMVPTQSHESSNYGDTSGGQQPQIGFSSFEHPAPMAPAYPAYPAYTQPQLPISTLPPAHGYHQPVNMQAFSDTVSQPAAPAATAGAVVSNPHPVPAGILPYDSKRAERVKKLCKFTVSSLNYEDVKTAVDCLTKALNLLTTGREEA
ncbi:vacuolar protein sorting-associated protein VTA1 homolog isoform X2 [Corticium candelabrum]|nr:vacuolar protein sorting-associated protein VTA1 homolog isoform X2 [Corticium candelabrum]